MTEGGKLEHGNDLGGCLRGRKKGERHSIGPCRLRKQSIWRVLGVSVIVAALSVLHLDPVP